LLATLVILSLSASAQTERVTDEPGVAQNPAGINLPSQYDQYLSEREAKRNRRAQRRAIKLYRKHLIKNDPDTKSARLRVGSGIMFTALGGGGVLAGALYVLFDRIIVWLDCFDSREECNDYKSPTGAKFLLIGGGISLVTGIATLFSGIAKKRAIRSRYKSAIPAINVSASSKGAQLAMGWRF
jgi:hypothetical protein